MEFRDGRNVQKVEIWSGGLYALGLPLPDGIASPQYFKSLRSSWIHQRVAYFGIYIWMLVIVQEIELGKRTKASETPILPADATGQVAATI